VARFRDEGHTDSIKAGIEWAVPLLAWIRKIADSTCMRCNTIVMDRVVMS
jgi:hypothetical protein